MGYKHIEVKQVTGFIGAEIGGVDLSRPLSEDQVQEIRKALLLKLRLRTLQDLATHSVSLCDSA